MFACHDGRSFHLVAVGTTRMYRFVACKRASTSIEEWNLIYIFPHALCSAPKARSSFIPPLLRFRPRRVSLTINTLQSDVLDLAISTMFIELAPPANGLDMPKVGESSRQTFSVRQQAAVTATSNTTPALQDSTHPHPPSSSEHDIDVLTPPTPFKPPSRLLDPPSVAGRILTPASTPMDLLQPRIGGRLHMPSLTHVASSRQNGMGTGGEITLVMLFVIAYGLSSAIVTVLCVRKARRNVSRRGLVDEKACAEGYWRAEKIRLS